VSFLLACPVCGPRDVYEFRYGGETKTRPTPDADPLTWAAYRYDKANVSGVEHAWWFHRAGCRRWFTAERDTRDNRVLAVRLPGAASEDPAADATATAPGAADA
jgi:heterotetrameric sarcosine oxidase delta subunit